jgi:hypothetical protein
MHRSGTSRGALVVGALLIVLGAAALAIQVSGVTIGWPAWVILPGLAMLVAAFALPEPGGSGLAAVGGIVTAVGTVLAVQDATGTYASWAYAWALVAPGGVGVGLLLYGLLTRRGDIARGGLGSLVTGIVLFLVGFLFFEGLLHLDGDRFSNLTGRTVPMASPVLAALAGRGPDGLDARRLGGPGRAHRNAERGRRPAGARARPRRGDGC